MCLRVPYRLLALRFGALVAIAAVVSAEEVTFKFAPPNGFTETILIRRSRTVTRGATVQTDVSETRYRWTAHETESGYRVERDILSNSLSRDGHNIASPMIAAMAGVKLVYTIDSEGKATGITGYNGILENLKSKFPPQLMQSFGPLFNAESLRKGDLAEWQNRVEKFAGRTVKIGEAWTSKENVPLPGGGGLNRTPRRSSPGGKTARAAPVYKSVFSMTAIRPNCSSASSKRLKRH